MGYYDRDEPGEPAATEPDRGSLVQLGMELAVRSLGVVVLVVGLWVAVLVVTEAWGLYNAPERIERLAVAVERGSNIDRALSPRRAAPPVASAPDALPEGGAAPAEAAPPPSDDEVRLSYFLAWFLAIALLFLASLIALGMVKTGGELALFDARSRRRRGPRKTG